MAHDDAKQRLCAAAPGAAKQQTTAETKPGGLFRQWNLGRVRAVPTLPAGPTMKVDAFDFDLPRDRIAQRPASPRDSARLLAVGETFHDRSVGDLPRLLSPGDVLVVNDTQVFPARLSGRRGAAAIEATLHRHGGPDAGPGVWHAFARPARRLKVGDRIDFADDLAAEVVGKGERGEVTLDFGRSDDDLMEALDRRGVMPLPPYIKPDPERDDRHDYQTLFAARPGAVAAPTAGLHFTPALVDALAEREVAVATVTLHVGAGTFLPVTVDTVGEHRMLPEWGEVDARAADAVNAARAQGRQVVAVGSTSLRLLECAADAEGLVAPFAGDTDLFIVPGYEFRVVDRMLTNFHLPRSTLFMLVAAFAGLDRMQAAYAHAIAGGYRFYSYGDACLLDRAEVAS
jgi:S-adenosylmethionine:tRNA ribosyltransferase-isomerase